MIAPFSNEERKLARSRLFRGRAEPLLHRSRHAVSYRPDGSRERHPPRHEWSINRSYNALRSIGEKRFGNLTVAVPTGPKWLSEMVCDNAEFSHRYYEKLIAHYDIHKGATRPEDGLDDIAKSIVAELLIYASTGLGHVLDAAITEAGVSAPEVTLTSETFLAMTQIPRKFIEKRLTNEEDRKLVAAIYDELKATGRVEHSLSEDDKTIRNLHYAEVLAPKLAERSDARTLRIHGTDDTPLELAVAKSAVPPAQISEQPPALLKPRRRCPTRKRPRAVCVPGRHFRLGKPATPRRKSRPTYSNKTLSKRRHRSDRRSPIASRPIGVHTVGEFLAQEQVISRTCSTTRISMPKRFSTGRIRRSS